VTTRVPGRWGQQVADTDLADGYSIGRVQDPETDLSDRNVVRPNLVSGLLMESGT